MSINILYKTGSAGIVTVGIYKTDAEPVYETYYADPNIDVGIVTSTSLSVSGLTTTQSLIVSGISTFGLSTTSSPSLNSQMSFELTSNTNLRIKVRGTDGVIRSTNLTLS